MVNSKGNNILVENRLLIGNPQQYGFLSNSITEMTEGISASDTFLFVPLHLTGTEMSEVKTLYDR